jgi:DNA-binding NarL/FixJ family response regulator
MIDLFCSHSSHRSSSDQIEWRVPAFGACCENFAMPDHAALHVLLADDHAMVRDGLRSLIEVDWPEARFTEARDQSSTLAALASEPVPDLAIVDVRMPGMRGVASFAEFRRANRETPMVVVTGLDDPGLAPSLMAQGAAAVMSKEASGVELLAALHRALADDAPRATIASSSAVRSKADQQGSHGLSDRQRDMLRLLHEGLPNKLIARRLGIAETTVKGHLHVLYDELRVRGRIEAVAATRDWML